MDGRLEIKGLSLVATHARSPYNIIKKLSRLLCKNVNRILLKIIFRVLNIYPCICTRRLDFFVRVEESIEGLSLCFSWNNVPPFHFESRGIGSFCNFGERGTFISHNLIYQFPGYFERLDRRMSYTENEPC